MDKRHFPSERESLQKDISSLQAVLKKESEKEQDVDLSITQGQWTAQTSVYETEEEILSNNFVTPGQAYECSGPNSVLTSHESNEESENIFRDMPNTPELCLVLNQAYQEMINETIDKLQLILDNNREQQIRIQEELIDVNKDGYTLKKVKTRKPITLFAAPYFRDVKGRIPFMNEDGKVKRQSLDVDAYMGPPRPWTSEDHNTLFKAVKSNARQIAMEPLMARKEFLCEKLKTGKITDEKGKEIEEKLEITEEEIMQIRRKTDQELLQNKKLKLDWLKISALHMDGTRGADDCEFMWNNYLHPSVNKGKWNKEEDESLRKAASKYKQKDWDSIAKELNTNRTAIQCLERYQSHLNTKMLRGPWTKAEDDLLSTVVEACRIGSYIPWNQGFMVQGQQGHIALNKTQLAIAYYIEGRSRLQITNRWSRSIAPENKRGPWCKEEDMILYAAVKKFGYRWQRVKDFLPGRTNFQCRERFTNTLVDGIKIGDWSAEEDHILVKLVKKYGEGKWTKIAAHLPERTDNMVLQRASRIKKHHPNIFNVKDEDANDDDDDDVDLTADFNPPAHPITPTNKCTKANFKRETLLSAAQEKIIAALTNHQAPSPLKDSQILPEDLSKTTTSMLMKMSKQLLGEPKKYDPSVPVPPRRRQQVVDDEFEEVYDTPVPASVGRRRKLPEEVLIEESLDALFTPLVAFSQTNRRKKSKIISRSKRQAAEREEVNIMLNKVMQAKIVEDDEVQVVSELPDKADLDFSNSVPNVFKNFIVGSVEENAIPVFPPNSTTIGAFKILLISQKQFDIALSNLTARDYLMFINLNSEDNFPKCPWCCKREQRKIRGSVKTYSKLSPVREQIAETTQESVGTCSKQPLAEKLTNVLTKIPRLCETEKPSTSSKENNNTEENEGCECEKLRILHEDYQLLRKRFFAMFLWPFLLSSVRPSEKQIDEIILKELQKSPSKSNCKQEGFKLRKRKRKNPWVRDMVRRIHGLEEVKEEMPAPKVPPKKPSTPVKRRRKPSPPPVLRRSARLSTIALKSENLTDKN